jgi:hypothetical protein
VFRKGHSIALNIMSENTEWVLPKTPDTNGTPDCVAANPGPEAQGCAKFNIIWNTNKIRVILPVVGGPKNPMDLFDFKHQHEKDCAVDDLPVCP